MAALVADGQTGLLFEPGNSADLAAKLTWAISHVGEMMIMGQRAREFYCRELTGEVNILRLTDIYSEAASHGQLLTDPIPDKTAVH